MVLNNPEAILLSGPTAVGKSSLAIEACRQHSELEIINADSVLFYRGFDIGSAKPTRAEQNEVVHHLVDVADPDQPMDVARFKLRVEELLVEIASRKRRALIVGGSGFYLKALRFGVWDVPGTSPEFRASLSDQSNEQLYSRLKEIDQAASKKIHISDRYRLIRALEIFELSKKRPSEVEQEHTKVPDSRFALWVVDRPKDEFELRLRARVQEMLSQGWLDEVKLLRTRFSGSRVLGAVGYAQVIQFLDQKTPEGRVLREGLLGLEDEIVLAHRQLSKSQRTWMRGLKPEKVFELDRQRDEFLFKISDWLKFR